MKRQKYKRKVFVSIGMVALNRLWHHVFIGWGGPALLGLIKSIFGSSNQIRFVWAGLTGRLKWPDWCELVQKSGNFQIP
jgi:hypothetical protein